MLKYLLALCLIIGGATIVISQSGKPTPLVAKAAVAQKAMELARIVGSEENVIGDEKSDKKAADFASGLFASDKDVAELDKEYPGIGMEMAWAAMPIINQSLKNRMPVLHSRLAKIYGATFDVKELQTLIDFYASPTGKKLVAAALENITPNAMLEEAKKSKDFKISSASVLSDLKEAVPSAMSKMDANDNAQMLRLAGSGLLPRMRAISLKVQDTQLKWMEESEPGEEDRLMKAMTEAIEKRQAAGK